MKKLFSYLNIAILFIALSAVFTACTDDDVNDSGNLGLNIKVFSPTVVVPGFPMTINGSGFGDVTEIEFPGGIKVTEFEIVTSEMIRVKAPQGLTESGKIIVRNSAGETAESRLPLSVGKTVVAGYSAQEEDLLKGNETLTVYGIGMNFVTGATFYVEDEEPIFVDAHDFLRIASGRVVIQVPSDITDGNGYVAIHLSDGQIVNSPAYTFEAPKNGGYWDYQKRYIWLNTDPAGNGEINWSSQYRLCLEGHDFNSECIDEIAADDWEIIKTGSFYLEAKGSDWVQMRITTGWWSTTWTGEDITTGNERIVDNGDGTYSMEINFEGDPILDLLDEQHLLFTGSGYTPLGLYVIEKVWVDGGEGHFETVRDSFWKNDGTLGDINWSSQYRFCIEGGDSNNECCYEFPAEIWEKLRTEPFRIAINKKADWVNLRVTTGWWSTNYMGLESLNDFIEQDEKGNYYVELNLSNDQALLDLIDVQHLLFTGQDYDLLEIYQEKQIWVDGGDGGEKETIIWEGDGSAGVVDWNGTYRFALEGHDGNNECIAEISAADWEVIKTGTFYLTAKGSDWVQMRITSGWWSTTWTGEDITTGSDRIVDNGDGTYTIEINFAGDPLLDVLDEQHLLFTGSGYTPLKLFYK